MCDKTLHAQGAVLYHGHSRIGRKQAEPGLSTMIPSAVR
jgi:hypothetical protein